MRLIDPANLRTAAAVATVLLLGSLLLAGCGGDSPETVAEPGVDPAPLMSISSTAFEPGAQIPAEHAREDAGGRNVSPPLTFAAVPEDAKSLALLCVDKHAMANGWVHWMVIDLPADTASLEAGASGSGMPAGSRELVNGFGSQGWGGPEPPPGSGPHEYAFTLYALDTATLELADGASLAEFQAAVAGHEVAASLLSGTFER